jgi:isopentenyl phosphate kinase
MKLWIIKLGGSVITDKQSGKPIVKKQLIRTICKEIARAYASDTTLHLIILHGAGSLAHPLAYKHNIAGAKLDSKSAKVVNKIASNMRFLTDIITESLMMARVPTVPLQTISLIESANGKLILHHNNIINKLIKNRCVPVFGGDTVVTSKGKIAIASADALAVLLAKKYRASKIIFVSDTDGVYESFPPHPGEFPLTSITRSGIKKLATGPSIKKKTDVTGGMQGKIKSLLTLNNVEVMIIGKNRVSLRKALANKKVGTTLKL